MKIAYFELGIADFYEDYSTNALGYGGGPCFARYAKEAFNNENDKFLLFGEKGHFVNVTDKENQQACIFTEKHILNNIRNGHPVVEFFPYLQDFDFFICHHDGIWINPHGTKAKTIHWSLMGGPPSTCHPNYDYSFLYNPEMFINNSNPKVRKIKIGKPVIDFNLSLKEDFIFQCSRHDRYFNTIEVAQNCLNFKIKGIFAGPILDNYPLMNFIDNKYTFYLGLISENQKNDYLKKARLTTYFHNWDPPFNLSAIESLAQGTPIFAKKVGFFKYLLNDSINGFEYNGSNFVECYDKATTLNQLDCWKSAKEYSHEEMLNSFYTNLKNIL